MATDPKPGGGTAVADDEYEYKAPTPAASDDEYDYHAPGTTVAAPKPAPTAVQPKPKSWLGQAWDAGVESLNHTPDPVSLFSRGAGHVADWAQQQSDAAHQQDLKDVAAGKPQKTLFSRDPASSYDMLARGARAISGGTSPQAAGVTAATMVAPEVMGPVLATHGGIGVVQGTQRMARGNFSPENVGDTLNSAGEAAGGAAMTGHSGLAPSGTPGPVYDAVRNRNPVQRGTVAYQRMIAPEGSPAVEQMDDAETIRRAAPYLAEEARKPGGPVTKNQPEAPPSKQPGKGPTPATPQAGEETGVMQYRQHAQTAAKGLWENKIEPLTKNYSKMPIDHTKVVSDIRGTVNPDSPADVARSKAINDFANEYDQSTSVGDAMRKIRGLNEDPQVQAYEKALPDKQSEMKAANPTLEAKLKAASSLREQVFDSIAKDGSAEDSHFIQEARKDWGALNQVSDNLGKVTVPTPGSLGERILDTAHAALRPKSAGVGAARRLWNNPNKLAAKSSRLFGLSDLQTRPVPPQSNVPWYQSSQPPFTAAPGAPQAPPPVPPQYATEDVGAPPPSTPRGTIPGIKGALPAPAETAAPPVPPNYRAQYVGPNDPTQVPSTAGGRGGTRFAPHGLLPAPAIEGTQPVGVLPPLGFPQDQGLWNVPPRPGSVPGWDTPPVQSSIPRGKAFFDENGKVSSFHPDTRPAAPRPGAVTRQGGLGAIEGAEKPNEFAGRTPPEADRPFPKSGVEHGVQRRTMWEKEADAKAADAEAKKNAPKEKPTEEQYTEAKNALKTPATLEPEDLQKHRATVRAYEGADKAETGKVVEAAKKGTANDRPQVQYKPSEKAATMSEKAKDLGPEFRTDQLTHEVVRNQGILDNPEATEEEKESANKFFEEHPDRKTDKTPAGATAAERIAARNGGAKPAGESKLGKLFHKDAGTTFATEAPKPSGAITYKTVDEGGSKWATTPDGKVRVSIKPGMKPADVQKLLDSQVEMQKNFFSQNRGEPEGLSAEDKAAAEAAKARKGNLFAKKNSSGASVDQTFGGDKDAELQAAEEHGERREANKGERLKDLGENAQRIFEGKETTPVKDVDWLKFGAKNAAEHEATRPVQHEFTQDEIRHGEMAALADAEATLQSDKPGIYFDRTEGFEQNPKNEQRSDKGVHAFGRFRGVTSGRGLYPVLERLPDMSATEVMRALRNPKSPAYQKVVRAAIQANKAETARSARLGLDKE